MPEKVTRTGVDPLGNWQQIVTPFPPETLEALAAIVTEPKPLLPMPEPQPLNFNLELPQPINREPIDWA